MTLYSFRVCSQRKQYTINVIAEGVLELCTALEADPNTMFYSVWDCGTYIAAGRFGLPRMNKWTNDMPAKASSQVQLVKLIGDTVKTDPIPFDPLPVPLNV